MVFLDHILDISDQANILKCLRQEKTCPDNAPRGSDKVKTINSEISTWNAAFAANELKILLLASKYQQYGGCVFVLQVLHPAKNNVNLPCTIWRHVLYTYATKLLPYHWPLQSSNQILLHDLPTCFPSNRFPKSTKLCVWHLEPSGLLDGALIDPSFALSISGKPIPCHTHMLEWKGVEYGWVLEYRRQRNIFYVNPKPPNVLIVLLNPQRRATEISPLDFNQEVLLQCKPTRQKSMLMRTAHKPQSDCHAGVKLAGCGRPGKNRMQNKIYQQWTNVPWADIT